MGRHSEAHADFSRAIELDPSLAGTFGAFLAGPATGKPGPPAGTASPAAETTIPPTSDSRRD
jgi:hypothetical protein